MNIDHFDITACIQLNALKLMDLFFLNLRMYMKKAYNVQCTLYLSKETILKYYQEFSEVFRNVQTSPGMALCLLVISAGV